MKSPYFIELRIKHKWRKRRVGFLFDMYSWFLIMERFGVDLEGIKGTEPKDVVKMMLYTSAVSACKEAGRKVWFTEADVQKWWANMTNSDSEELNRAFNESMKVIEKMGTKPKDDESKKNKQ